MGDTTLDWSVVSESIINTIGQAFPLILGVMALIMGITIGVKLFKRYAK